MPKFSLRQIFVALVALAMGFTIYRLPQGSWIDIPLSTLGFYFVLSLTRHAAATRRSLIDSADPPREQIWGGRILIVVLAGTAMALVVAWILDLLAAAGMVLITRQGNDVAPYSYVELPTLPRDLALLAMLVAIALGSRQSSPAKAIPVRQKIYQAVAVAGALIGIVAYWADRMKIWFLVYIAINGVEAYLPQGSWPPEINVSTALRAQRFMLASAAGLPFVLANLMLVGGLVKWWNMPRRRWVFAISLAAGLAGECSIATWLAVRGVRQLSPPYQEAIQIPRAAILDAASMVLLAAGGFTWRLLAGRSLEDGVSLTPNRPLFFHESWLGGLAVGAVALALVVNTVTDNPVSSSSASTARNRFPPPNPFFSLNPFSTLAIDWQTLFYSCTNRPAQLIALAAVLGGLALAWFRWRRRREPIVDVLPSVDPVLFGVTMTSLLLMLVAAAPIIAAASFSYWLLRAALDI